MASVGRDSGAAPPERGATRTTGLSSVGDLPLASISSGRTTPQQHARSHQPTEAAHPGCLFHVPGADMTTPNPLRATTFNRFVAIYRELSD
jgi:hypothetical protein